MTGDAALPASSPAILDTDDYFAALYAAGQQAIGQAAHSADYTIGGQRWQIRCGANGWAARYLHALDHLRVPAASTAPSLTVHLWDEAETGVGLPPLPRPWDRRLPHSLHLDFDAERGIAVFHTGLHVVFDRAARQCWVWHPDGASLPPWDDAAPLRDLIETWFNASNLVRVHAGAVGDGTGAVLIVGVSGSGKSTTTLACLRAGLHYLGDDYVLVDPDRAFVHSLYHSGKLTPNTLVHFPELTPHVANPDSMTDFKAILYMADLFPQQMSASSPLKAILIPTITGQPHTHLTLVSPMLALRALAPSTLFQAAQPSADEFAKIGRLVRSVPAFRLHAGTDFTSLTDCIERQLKDHLSHA